MRRFLGIAAVVLLLSSCITGVPPREAAKAYYDLGNAYAKLGDQEKATAAYLRALALDSSLFQASYNLARVYIESAQYEKASAILDGLLKKDPKNVITLETLGYLSFKQNKLDVALVYYRRALDYAPEAKDALYNVALILEKQGKTAEALSDFEHLYKISQDRAVLAHIGLLEIALGDLPAGIHYLEAYQKEKGDDFDVLVALGRAYQKEEEFDRAIATYDAALAVKPKAAEVLFSKAVILLTAIDEEVGGLSALKQAIDAGFSDGAQARALASDPHLIDASKVAKVLIDARLITPSETKPAAPPPNAKPPGGEKSGEPLRRRGRGGRRATKAPPG